MIFCYTVYFDKEQSERRKKSKKGNIHIRPDTLMDFICTKEGLLLLRIVRLTR